VSAAIFHRIISFEWQVENGMASKQSFVCILSDEMKRTSGKPGKYLQAIAACYSKAII
jgi:hypothetical protein